MFRVLTDTSANLPTELAQRNRVGVIPFLYTVNGTENTCPDTQDFDGISFYNAMRTGASVTTSQISPMHYYDFMQPVLAAGEDVLFVGMSSGISGSFHCAELAAEELCRAYPERRLRLIDTLGASLGEGLLVLRALRERLSGRTLDEVADTLLQLRHRLCNVFTVDDLSYLRRGGRLSNMAFIVGSLLHIKPLLKGNEQGRIVAFSKQRGRKRAIEALAERYDAYVLNPGEQTVGVAHADCPEDASLLIRLLNRRNPPKEILNVCYEPVTGSHVGPGTLALFFEAKEGVRAMT